jgi:formylglycine-generating enzyme required for sulfatase activity
MTRFVIVKPLNLKVQKMKFFLFAMLVLSTKSIAQILDDSSWRKPGTAMRWKKPSDQQRAFSEATADCKSLNQVGAWRLPTRAELDDLRKTANQSPFADSFKDLIWSSESHEGQSVGYYGPTGDLIEYALQDPIAGAGLCIANESSKNCKNGPLDMVFCTIPAGKFLMGAKDGVGEPNEHPRREVTITKDVEIMDTEVTQAQWFSVTQKMPAGALLEREEFRNPNFPVLVVSIHQIDEFIDYLNQRFGDWEYEYRLPTEAEWEYAARGTFATDIENIEPKVFKSERSPLLKIIRQGKANPFGIYNMTESPAEFVSDLYRDMHDLSRLVDPVVDVGPGSWCVIRGGFYFRELTTERWERSDEVSLTARFSASTYPYPRGFRLIRQKKSQNPKSSLPSPASQPFATKPPQNSPVSQPLATKPLASNSQVWAPTGKLLIATETANMMHKKAIMAQLEVAEVVEVFNDADPHWVGVEIQGRKGFVERRFLIEYIPGCKFQTVMPFAAKELRSGDKTLAIVPRGTELLVINRVGEWDEVQYQGLRGYLARNGPELTHEVDIAYDWYRNNTADHMPMTLAAFEINYREFGPGYTWMNASNMSDLRQILADGKARFGWK